MNYGQCQEYLREIIASGIKFGLDNVRTVLSSLGRPELQYPSVLVAGTNGKGSVCSMLAEILSLHGHNVGLFTSPHLVRVEERIRVGGETISPRDFCFLLTRLKRAIEDLVKSGKLPSPLTYFETLTVLALLYFSRRRVDIAVLEVGMGGRLDATNVVTPLVSVITSVSHDHQEFLGRTLGRIALEKAGIIRPGVPVVCGLFEGTAARIIKKKAGELDAPFLGVFEDSGVFRFCRTRAGLVFSFRWRGRTFRFSPALKGEHQGRNGAVAIAAALELSRRWKALDEKRILRGIEQARWEGRLEVVSRRPTIVLDGAHNEEGARAAAAYARDFLPRPLTLVFGIMKDKNIRKVARHLFPLASKIIITSMPYERAASPEHIFASSPLRGGCVFLEPDPIKAVNAARCLTPPEGSILITGSLFLVGEIKKAGKYLHLCDEIGN
jgi:dihydrofolate synthase/folylpolyglutamate synthase